jgi:formyltetrahydrofolate-dependent phosphoribosylglycinamide formyltransferase
MKKIAVFVSGSGTNLQCLIDNQNIYKISLVCSNKECYGIERAKTNKIKTAVILKKDFKTRLDFDLHLCQMVLEEGVDLIVLAGFMHILSADFISKFKENSIINLHPALPGQFDGAKAIERSFEAFQKKEITHTGVMIHYVIPEVDKGPVIVQERVDFKEQDTLESLEDRIHSVEHKLIVQGTELALMAQD